MISREELSENKEKCDTQLAMAKSMRNTIEAMFYKRKTISLLMLNNNDILMTIVAYKIETVYKIEIDRLLISIEQRHGDYILFFTLVDKNSESHNVSIKIRLNDCESKAAKLKDVIDSIVTVENALKELVSDYNDSLTNYEQYKKLEEDFNKFKSELKQKCNKLIYNSLTL